MGNKRLVTTLCVVGAGVILAGTVVFVGVKEYLTRVFTIRDDGSPVTVVVYTKPSLDSVFGVASMGQTYDYDLVIKENKPFGHRLLKETFTFKDDGAPIHDNDVSVEYDEDSACITISGSEMSDKVFEVELD